VGLLVVLVPLALLSYYLLSFDYLQPQPPPVGRRQTGEVRAKIELPAGTVRAGGPCVAVVTLRNATGSLLAIADVEGPFGLFAFEVTRGGVQVPLVPRSDARALPWRPGRDARVELLPGASYSRSFNLAALCRLNEPGTYSVVAVYDPEAYFALAGAAPGGDSRVWLGLARSEQAELVVSPAEAGSRPGGATARPPGK
jgi:hypothetical protein